MDYEGALGSAAQHGMSAGRIDSYDGGMIQGALQGGAAGNIGNYHGGGIQQAALYGGAGPIINPDPIPPSAQPSDRPSTYSKPKLHIVEEHKPAPVPIITPSAPPQQEPNKSLQNLEKTYLPTGFQPW